MGRTARDLHSSDVNALQALLESVPEYAERLTGYPPGPSDALSALIAVPPDFDPSNKRSLGLWTDEELVAFADVLLAHPQPDTAYIGLLIVHGGCQGQGIGRALHDALITRLRAETGIERVRLGVVDTVAAQAAPFWQALGYAPTGEQKPYSYDHVVSTATMWERPVDRE